MIIADRDDIVVADPVPRETIRSVEEGYLVTCTDNYCDWQGLFPGPDLAATACERHYDHERRSGQYHYGDQTYVVVELLNAETACTLDASQLGLSVEEISLGTRGGGVREVEFPRTTGDVSELVERGDCITRPHHDGTTVLRVSETRSLGLPTWTVVYVASDVDLLKAQTSDYKWLNECIAHDGDVYCRYKGRDQPRFEVVGQGDFQASWANYGGASG